MSERQQQKQRKKIMLNYQPSRTNAKRYGTSRNGGKGGDVEEKIKKCINDGCGALGITRNKTHKDSIVLTADKIIFGRSAPSVRAKRKEQNEKRGDNSEDVNSPSNNKSQQTQFNTVLRKQI